MFQSADVFNKICLIRNKPRLFVLLIKWTVRNKLMCWSFQQVFNLWTLSQHKLFVCFTSTNWTRTPKFSLILYCCLIFTWSTIGWFDEPQTDFHVHTDGRAETRLLGPETRFRPFKAQSETGAARRRSGMCLHRGQNPTSGASVWRQQLRFSLILSHDF